MKLYGVAGIAFFSLWIAAIAGWIMNIVEMFGDITTNELIIRAIGIFVAPAGALMGWFM
ncbi:hypothetical protein PUNNY_71 [Escherichia phage_vB_EcoD_Punny]|jgi:hypothetical protein|uniref:TMhelix containing protein n=8 Tax=Tlsvirus TaxID=1920865 RepID=A0A7D7IWE2_9CAUD|nr:hypothetical protein BI068_gp78 [Salmonella phage phSE-2]YP_009812428.1 hypothetical protein HOU20_gp10 [Citrobacter phage Sazh]ANA49805.1 hypothetical protein [Salmonella phage phSE-5]QMP82769.1 hypothetical protein [Escherichia phage vB_EcoS_011D2]QPX76332.1 hypothetical protein ZEROTOHERO_67 [Citrobacter phage vB_CfrD_ZerotoHero]UGO48719.1 hypothetical protein ELISACORREA_58 [Citrobacter phage vB_CfrD_ElisaCorrea]UGO52126.1 hypothetical protein BROOKSBY_67 [Citrobacter phage vB_CfrD_Bro